MHNLEATKKWDFFVTLRRLSAVHGRLPESMMITGKIEVEDEILASGGYSDVRCGTYKGRRVAVRTLRVTAKDNVSKLRNVSTSDVSSFPDAALIALP